LHDWLAVSYWYPLMQKHFPDSRVLNSKQERQTSYVKHVLHLAEHSEYYWVILPKHSYVAASMKSCDWQLHVLNTLINCLSLHSTQFFADPLHYLQLKLQTKIIFTNYCCNCCYYPLRSTQRDKGTTSQ
jgi:hypothetical protein